MIYSSSAPRSLEDMKDTLRALQSLGSRPRTQVIVWFTPSYATSVIFESELKWLVTQSTARTT